VINRKLWYDHGGGNCEWTGSTPFDAATDHIGTLFAGYPASGMRVTWQQTEAITGKQLVDDFFRLEFPKIGLVKTQYPHYEGIWSYGDNLDQVVLVVRNPRWAMPSYHTLINEIGYAHTWELAYDRLPNVFTKRAPMETWTKWRDYRFWEEIVLWGWHIDFYMSNGTKYWRDMDFERNGQWPFYYYNETERPWPQDDHCKYDIDCYPKTVISYDKLKDPINGPIELRKIAGVLRGIDDDMDVAPDELMDCMCHETFVKTPSPSNDNRDLNSLPREAYKFTLPQLNTMKDKLDEYIDKYSTGEWVADQNAIDLVSNFNEWVVGVEAEIAEMIANPPPTPAPYAEYDLDLQEWYKSLGKGYRNDPETLKNKGIWDLVKDFYDDDTLHS